MISKAIVVSIVLAISINSFTAISLSGCKILDLTHALAKGNPYYPVYKPFEIEQIQGGKFEGVDWVAYKLYTTYEHLGTHMDAPYHFDKDGAKTDKVPLSSVIGEACVIDVRRKVRRDRGYLLTKQDILEWEEEHGRMTEDCIVLLNTGQDKMWSNMAAYFGTRNVRDASTYRYPSFSGEAAVFLTEERKVKAAGVDVISLDGPNPKFPAHIAFLKNAGIPGFENLKNLHKLPARNATVIAAPIKILNGSGAQIRAFAVGWNGPNDPCRKQGLEEKAEKEEKAEREEKAEKAKKMAQASAAQAIRNKILPTLLSIAFLVMF